MGKLSAGLLMYRIRNGELEFLLAHPGGPFWKNRDAGSWTIPKGELNEDEDPLACACREFEEELGISPQPPFIELTPIVQKGGKTVHAWAFAGDCAVESIRSNTFKLEWPPKSGRFQEFPEIDRVEFFNLTTAQLKLIPAQFPLLEELQQKLA
jgi:predicted NUDIX family NTP pyrophosphohydrolase